MNVNCFKVSRFLGNMWNICLKSEYFSVNSLFKLLKIFIKVNIFKIKDKFLVLYWNFLDM